MRWSWGLLRIGVSALVLVWIFSHVPLRDRPRVRLEVPSLSPPRIEGDVVREDASAVTVRIAAGQDITVGRDRIAATTPLPPRRGVVSILSDASPSGIAGFLALSCIPFLLTSWRWWLLVADQQVTMSYAAAVRLGLIGTFFNNFLLGATGGDVVKAAVAGTGTGKTARLLSTVLLDRIIGLSVVILIGSGALLAYLPFAAPEARERLAVPGLMVSVALLGFLAAYLVFYSRTLRGSALARAVKDRVPFRRPLREMDGVFQDYRAKPRLAAATLGISVASQAILITAIWVGGGAVGITEAPPLHYFVMIPLIEVATALPISFGGWGVGEAAYRELFGLAGVEAGKAVALSLLGKVVVVLYGIPGGLFFALGKRGRGGTGQDGGKSPDASAHGATGAPSR